MNILFRPLKLAVPVFRFLLECADKTIKQLEAAEIPFATIILTFFFAVTLRNFIELFSDHGSISLGGFLHLYAAYLALALTLVLLFHLAAKIPVIKAARVIFPSFIILISAPILDLLLSRGAGFDMNYMLPGLHDNLFYRFVTFFGPLQPMAVTPGIRLEIAFVLLASFLFFYAKTVRCLRSLFFTFLMYCVFFIYGAFPFALKGLKYLTGLPFWSTDLVLAFFAITISLFLGTLLAYLANPVLFRRILKDVCPYRVAHYELMIVMGIVIGLNTAAFHLTQRNVFYFLFLPLGGFCAGMYSLLNNNLADVQIDQISGPHRALAANKVAVETYQKLQPPFFLLAIFLTALINFQILFLTLLFMGNYFLYSNPPLRLKRITFLSKLVVSLNSLLMVMVGYILIAGSLNNFPLLVSLFFLLVFTAPVNFIDLKDYAGDRQLGIKTLPVVLGLQRAQRLIGLFFVVAYLVVGLIIKNTVLFLPIILLGITQYYWITQPNYQEAKAFQTYLFSLIGFILYLALFKLSL